MTRILGLIFALCLFVAPERASAQAACETFDGGLAGWELCRDYGGGGTGSLDASTGVLKARDGNNGNHICTGAGFKGHGDWFAAGDCLEVCLDVNRLSEGSDNPNVGHLAPRISIFNGTDFAIFKWSRTLTAADGWVTLCAPVKKLDPDEPMPSASDGAWVTNFGSDPARWNALFGNVTKVQLPLDSNRNIHEEVAYDNICIKGVTCPGDDEIDTDETDEEDHAGKQCTPFEGNVTCDPDTGRWDVQLSNTAQSLFAPDSLQISTPNTALTLHQDTDNPLLVSIEGANPGDQITLSVNAVQDSAGGLPGMDLCCMGDMEITIPQGETCEAPPPDRDLSVHKTCGALPPGAAFGANVECVFTVNYSGPPPTVGNELTISDTLVSGGPMIMQTNDHPWSCPQGPVTGPFECTLGPVEDPTTDPNYWLNYSSSFAVQFTATEPYRNCAKASIETSAGNSIGNTSCFEVGAEHDLTVEKRLADGQTFCEPGKPCYFEIVVTNQGPDTYAGPVTLTDQVTINDMTGITHAPGSLTGIAPPVCAPADLSGVGCDDTVSLSAGQSTTYVIEYTPDPGLAAIPPDHMSGENCVTLSDTTMSAEDDPRDMDGQHACVTFALGEDDVPPVPTRSLEVTKTCEVIEAFAGAPARVGCEITVQGQGLIEGNTLDLSDVLTGFTTGTGFLGDPWFDGDLTSYPCTHNNQTAQSACLIPVSAAMAQGGALTLSGVIAMEPWQQGDALQNCAEVKLREDATQTAKSCAEVTLPGFDGPVDDEEDTPPPLLDKPRLELVKQPMAGGCTVNKAAQRYECVNTIELRNLGTGDYDNPLVITDAFTSEPKPQTFTLASGAGWSCQRASADAASCTHARAQIPAGGSMTLSVLSHIPGLREGGSYTNCAALQVPDDAFLRTQMVQQILQDLGYDVGVVDGAYGPRTRRAISALQNSLGVAPTGVIDDDLFAALGLQSDGAPHSCATSDLAPMPEVICPKGQRKNSKGICYTPEKKCERGFVKNAAGQCVKPVVTCKEGQKKNSKGQCYWPKCPAGEKRNSKGQCYVVDSGPSCDARTTVKRGERCVCRFNGMKPITPTRCGCGRGSRYVAGAGCVSISIGGGGGVAGEGDGRGKTCVTVAGITRCF